MEERIRECNGIGIAPVPAPTSQSRGCSKFDTCKEQSEHFFKLNFTGPKIAGLLGVSLHTLRRRMNKISCQYLNSILTSVTLSFEEE